MRPPLPPFTAETAARKVRLAEDGWNGRDAEKVSLAYTPDSVWRNRDQFIRGRAEIISFLTTKWQAETEYRLMKERHASINDLPISEHERLFLWPRARRPDNHPGLSELGL